jgi:methylthioribose-1-phosphate isomerase
VVTVSEAPSWFTLRWNAGRVELLDQRLLPSEERYLLLGEVEELAVAIEELAVRGAPAIGCAAAMGVALGAETSAAESASELIADLEARVIPRLASTRPTAVNLFWALNRMGETLARLAAAPGADAQMIRSGLVEEAEKILEEDKAICREIGRAGVELVPAEARVMTHCNAGALATGGYGTALGVIRAAVEAGRRVRVLADETRPLLQGARLTAWELSRDEIPVEVCTDSMAGQLMQQGEVDLVVVGADRIAANGDVANKIGTYGLAVLAQAHDIPFYVAAPLSTIDLEIPDGASIPIEIRGRDEVARIGARTLLPDAVGVRQSAFDVTPAGLVTALVTEKGLVRSPREESIRKLFAPPD